MTILTTPSWRQGVLYAHTVSERKGDCRGKEQRAGVGGACDDQAPLVGWRLKPRLDGPSGLLPLRSLTSLLAFGSRVSPAATKPACAG